MWHILGEKKSIHQSKWPKWDKSKIIEANIKIVLQVNGKVRAAISVNHDISEEDVKSEALKCPAILPWIQDKEIKRIIYVKGRLVNIVV